MATLSAVYPTYLDVAKRLDPSGNIDAIVEIMSENNTVIQDGMASEGNLTTGHRSTQRTGLPTATWRLLNAGVDQSKSTTVQVDDACGMLESYAEVDKKLANLNGNSAQFMASEDTAFLESMSQTMESTTFYGDTSADPEKFMGLTPRYTTYNVVGTTPKTSSSYNVIHAGGTTADVQSSVWFVTWGPQGTFFIYPKGSQAGYTREFLGQKTLTDAAGKQYEGYRTHYGWDIGLSVRDWRSNVRICNVESTDAFLTAKGAEIMEWMIRARHRMRKTGGRTVMYCTEQFHTWLDISAQQKSNVFLSHREYAGQDVLHFRDIPIRQTDGLLDTEALVAADS